jgi:hypothetical protein
LREALALWWGPALADVADELALAPVARWLNELRLLALEQRLEPELAAGAGGQLPDLEARPRPSPKATRTVPSAPVAQPQDRPRLGDQGEPPGPWGYHRRGWALRFWEQWNFWATRSRLQPVINVAKMLARDLDGVLNYFSAAPITNAAAEGLNSKIQTIKKMAYGDRNPDRFKTAILFHCGGLNLYPATATHANAGCPSKTRTFLKKALPFQASVFAGCDE